MFVAPLLRRNLTRTAGQGSMPFVLLRSPAPALALASSSFDPSRACGWHFCVGDSSRSRLRLVSAATLRCLRASCGRAEQWRCGRAATLGWTPTSASRIWCVCYGTVACESAKSLRPWSARSRAGSGRSDGPMRYSTRRSTSQAARSGAARRARAHVMPARQQSVGRLVCVAIFSAIGRAHRRG